MCYASLKCLKIKTVPLKKKNHFEKKASSGTFLCSSEALLNPVKLKA